MAQSLKKSGLNSARCTTKGNEKLLGKNSVHFDKNLQWKMTFPETRV